jgi:hypothetical protein
MWASYAGLTTHKCLPLTLTLKDLTTLMAGNSDNTAAELFREDHALANTTLLNKIVEELTSRPVSLSHVLTYFCAKTPASTTPPSCPCSTSKNKKGSEKYKKNQKGK